MSYNIPHRVVSCFHNFLQIYSYRRMVSSVAFPGEPILPPEFVGVDSEFVAFNSESVAFNSESVAFNSESVAFKK